MEQLTCKTPAMVRKELWAHFLGYNLVRKVAAQAAWERGLCPRQISFAGTVQTLAAFGPLLIGSEPEQRAPIGRQMLWAIAMHEVGDRPGRVEPRRVKRRQGNNYPTMNEPRAQARERLRNPKA
jgi:hypothetical protein